MKKIIICFLTLSSTLCFGQAPYSFVANWTFEGNTNVGVINVTTAVTTSATFGSGVSPISYSGGNGGGSAYSADGNWTTAAAPNANDYIEVCVNTNSGTKFVSGSTVSFSFDERRSGTGVRELEVDVSSDNFANSTFLGNATTAIPDNTSFRSQGPYDYVLPSAVSSLCFRVYGYAAEAATGTWRFDNMQISGVNSLPIELSAFTASPQSNSIQLNFTTETERDNDHFSIERSSNGIQYTEIGQVKGAGTSYEPRNYTFTDERPLQGRNYYRLRQVDFDGQFSFSPVVLTQFGKANPMTLAPLPATETLNIQLDKALKADGDWQIFDMSGRLMLAGAMLAETNEQAIPIYTLPAGGYVLRLVVGQEVMVESFRKND